MSAQTVAKLQGHGRVEPAAGGYTIDLLPAAAQREGGWRTGVGLEQQHMEAGVVTVRPGLHIVEVGSKKKDWGHSGEERC